MLDVPADGSRRDAERSCRYLRRNPSGRRRAFAVTLRAITACMILSHEGYARPLGPAPKALRSHPRVSGDAFYVREPCLQCKLTLWSSLRPHSPHHLSGSPSPRPTMWTLQGGLSSRPKPHPGHFSPTPVEASRAATRLSIVVVTSFPFYLGEPRGVYRLPPGLRFLAPDLVY